MKLKIFILVFLLLPLIGFSQANLMYVKSYDSTFTILNTTYPLDTLWKFTKYGDIFRYENNVPIDTLAKKSDLDTTNIKGLDQYVTIRVIEASGGITDHSALSNRDIADQHPISAITDLQDSLTVKANIDNIDTNNVIGLEEFVTNRATEPPIDGIWDWNGTAYSPYPAFQANSWYSGTSTPTGTTRLTYDGYLYATLFASGAMTFTNGIIQNGRGNFVSSLGGQSAISGVNTQSGGVAGSGINANAYFNYNYGLLVTNGNQTATTTLGNAPMVFIDRDYQAGSSSDITSNILEINDSPQTSGTTSGKILYVLVDNNERIIFHPRQTDGVLNTAYFLDTKNSLSTAKLFDVRNQGISKFWVKNDTTYVGNRIKFADGTTQSTAGGGSGISHATSDGNYYASRNGAWESFSITGGTGDVIGPASSVDDRIATFDGITGKLIQDSGSPISDVTSNTSFRSTPSTVITAGTNLSWSGNTLNASGTGPAGSDGYIQYNNDYAFGGASALYYSDITNRLGINTTAPASLLTISASSGTIAGGLTFNTTATVGIWRSSTNALMFANPTNTISLDVDTIRAEEETMLVGNLVTGNFYGDTIFLKSGGYIASIDTGKISILDLNTTGTPSATNYLRGDGTWAVPSGGSSTPDSVYQTLEGTVSITTPKLITDMVIISEDTITHKSPLKDAVELEVFDLLSSVKILASGQIVPGTNIITPSATPVYNCNLGNIQQMSLTANVTGWTITNAIAGGSYTIYFKQDATGGRTIANLTGATKTANSLSFNTTANADNIVNIIVKPDGTIYWSVVEHVL